MDAGFATAIEKSLQISSQILSQIFSETTLPVFKQIGLLSIGIFLYSFIAFNFYRGMSKRDFVRIDTAHKSAFVRLLLWIFKFMLALPFLVFLWFAAISGVLLVLSNQEPTQIFILSIAIITAVRIAAYYKEELSAEIAKTLPIVLLATLLSSPNLDMLSNALPRITDAVTGITTIWSFLLVVILIEMFLRAIYMFFYHLWLKADESSPAEGSE